MWRRSARRARAQHLVVRAHQRQGRDADRRRVGGGAVHQRGRGRRARGSRGRRSGAGRRGRGAGPRGCRSAGCATMPRPVQRVSGRAAASVQAAPRASGLSASPPAIAGPARTRRVGVHAFGRRGERDTAAHRVADDDERHAGVCAGAPRGRRRRRRRRARRRPASACGWRWRRSRAGRGRRRRCRGAAQDAAARSKVRSPASPKPWSARITARAGPRLGQSLDSRPRVGHERPAGGRPGAPRRRGGAAACRRRRPASARTSGARAAGEGDRGGAGGR